VKKKKIFKKSENNEVFLKKIYHILMPFLKKRRKGNFLITCSLKIILQECRSKSQLEYMALNERGGELFKGGF